MGICGGLMGNIMHVSGRIIQYSITHQTQKLRGGVTRIYIRGMDGYGTFGSPSNLISVILFHFGSQSSRVRRDYHENIYLGKVSRNVLGIGS